ncbi:hypothetical protein DL767_002015 [Monosporascus sp. MG133]|nr:hypothetical protein DL767_002015 [Monosporascus sp. MG133]
MPVTLIDRSKISEDARAYTFSLPDGDASENLEDRSSTGHDSCHGRGVRDGDGTFDLTIETYFPGDKQPGGAMSNILDFLPIGEQVELPGPTGEILYNGKGNFMIEGQKLRVVDANKSEKDILLRVDVDKFQTKSRGQLSVTHDLSHPGDSWEGFKGHVN